MPAFRLTPIVIIIVGSVLCIGAPVGIYFGVIKNTQQKIADQQAIVDANQKYVGPGPLMAAQRALETAKSQLVQTQGEWDFIMRTKNPKIDMSDRFTAWEQYWKELGYTLAPMIDKFWLRNVRSAKGHADVAVPLGRLSYDGKVSPDPNNFVSGSILTIPLSMTAWPQGGANGQSFTSSGGGGGSISVMGTFDADLRNVGEWNKFSRIVKIDGLSLSGYSPFITASYNATIYEFLTNADKPGPAVPSGGAPSK